MVGGMLIKNISHRYTLFHLRLSEDVNDFLLVLLIVNRACLNVHLASLIVDRCSCLFVDTIERL